MKRIMLSFKEIIKVFLQYSKTWLTGGREYTLEDYLNADDSYNIIRKLTDDISIISKNTGIPAFKIQKIKNHLFLKRHLLDRGLERFDSDPAIAEAWYRLINNQFDSNDLKLLEHEYFESRFEGLFKTDYRTAHNATIRSGRLSGLD